MFLPFTNRELRISVWGALVLAAVLAPVGVGAQPAVQCNAVGAPMRVAELPEGSGLAASRRTPGRLWSHNDSGDPELVALDDAGRVTGRLRIDGATVDDWEAVSVGQCPSGSCIYLADIGDNDAERDRITIYRIPEPAAASGSAKVSGVFHATYPDGAHDAESLLIAADGRLHVVTKGETGPVSLYRFPNELKDGTTVRLERVGGPREPHPAAKSDRVTDGAVSPNGQWIALRTLDSVGFYLAAELLAGKWREVGRVPLATLGEPQGEGVTFGSDSTLYLMSEGGDKKQSGAFARLTCALKP